MISTLKQYSADELVSVYERTEDTGIEYMVRPGPKGYTAWVSYWGKVVIDKGFLEKDYGSDARTYTAVLEWFAEIRKTADTVD